MYYAIGDIHGRFDMLKPLYEKILRDIDYHQDPHGNTIIFLGDYIDRGPHSKEVLDFLMSLEDSEYIKHQFIMGNHELLMIDSYRTEVLANVNCWLSNGGNVTLASFETNLADFYDGSLLKYIEWMENNCKGIFATLDYVFCHGGVERVIPLEEQDMVRTAWMRQHYKNFYDDYGKVVIHGHTPTKDNEPDIQINEVNVDVGSFYSGRLAAVVLPHVKDDDYEVRFIKQRAFGNWEEW